MYSYFGIGSIEGTLYFWFRWFQSKTSNDCFRFIGEYTLFNSKKKHFRLNFFPIQNVACASLEVNNCFSIYQPSGQPAPVSCFIWHWQKKTPPNTAKFRSGGGGERQRLSKVSFANQSAWKTQSTCLVNTSPFYNAAKMPLSVFAGLKHNYKMLFNAPRPLRL